MAMRFGLACVALIVASFAQAGSPPAAVVGSFDQLSEKTLLQDNGADFVSDIPVGAQEEEEEEKKKFKELPINALGFAGIYFGTIVLGLVITWVGWCGPLGTV